MQDIIYKEFAENSINSLYALIILSLLFSVSVFFSRKLSGSDRKAKQFRMRSLYVCIIFYVFVLARIWVEGFTHIIAVLGLVSAALVVTNKETIMNMTGWLIINWRELFTEGDLVKIDKNKGYIKSIGFLYFSMEEVFEKTDYLKTGRMLKIPNNIIIQNTIINYTYETRPILQNYVLTFKSDSDIKEIKTLIESVLEKLTQDIAKQRTIAKNKKSKIKHSTIEENNKSYYVSFNIKNDKDLLIEADIYFYSYIDEYESMKFVFMQEILPKLNQSKKVTVS